MWKNYLIIAFRNLLRQKGYSIINILGLAIGMACSILILLWVLHELSYDRFNEKSDRIYRLVQTQYYSTGPLTTTCMPGIIATDIKADIPEVVNSFMFYTMPANVSCGEKVFSERVYLADPECFQVFDFKFIEGDPEHIFDEVTSVILTEEAALKYFGEEDPIGKILKLNQEEQFKVTGIIEEPPTNSSLRFDICIPFRFLEKRGRDLDRYGWNTYYCYVELHPEADFKIVNEKIKDFMLIKNPPEEGEAEDVIDLFMWPLEKMHLYSVRGGGDIQYVYIFSAIAIFILIIACVNFMNLATARSVRRSREIGLRKTVGALRGQIVKQFLGESLLLSFFSLIIAVILVYLLIEPFNNLAEKELVFNLLNVWTIAGLLLIILFVGVLAGIYPAFFMSSFRPVKVLKEFSNTSKRSANFRKVLVVFQFTLSIILIICTIIVFKQLNFLQDKKTGIEKENVLYVYLHGNLGEKFDDLKTNLLQSPYIQTVSRGGELPYWIGSNSGGFNWEGRESDDEILIGFSFVDYDYAKTFQMKMADGRFFSEEFVTDSAGVVLNEKAVELMGMVDPVGKWLEWGDRYRIIGVMKDFHFQPLTREIEPLSIWLSPQYCRSAFIRIDENNTDEAIDYVEDVWTRLASGFPFEYRFIDAMYDQMYREEKKLGEIFQYFALLAIFISCLGLFGLAAFMAEQRTKEIGIRKAMGASVMKILVLMTRNFLRWVIIANIVAWPIAWYLMKQWLDEYAYHTKITYWIFLAAIGLSVVIALLTVVFQALVAANKNPANTLKYE